ncbi:MAG: 3-oxoacyl-ACP reductase FabG [Solirubrobacterales bacterium]
MSAESLAEPSEGGCALVTGASRGIGAETARLLAQDGWTVGVNYRADADGAGEVVRQITDAGGRALMVEGDVSESDAVDGIFQQLEESVGAVRVLVNNAGMREDMLTVSLGEDAWLKVVDTNLSAAFRTTRRALMPMVRGRWGRIVNVASIVGMRANPGQANYAASKAGLIGFTKTVAAEVARRNVTVNAVAPGFIRTAMTSDVGEELLRAIPARRAGAPGEVAACIRFLVSPGAGYITGATIPIDGGLSA